ncbi:type VI secretion system tip protein TssI/VgrG [Citrobacter freundii]|uniref:type VI secretion system Vgr family protein n=1 Tax=Citrobacter freundii TaxID=546 RepID=UPI0015EABF6B|nr:type VI secretion system tip protein VgrG [Citrobacter freundii]ELT7648816.1 type VI secretion system tip protein VgrG [Citrobacter freundii]MDV1270192.1 type VI secretion system tip protein TssI/VgrG [Citrobacter freundii]MEB0410152.1 type VI secretion system tip protein TssI/VgrG [Citrobacter freundii]QLR18803.1 type VI secretion system tip protein VgrG [Citrobacter freundii]
MSQQGLRFTLDVDGLLAMSTAVVSFILYQNLSTPFTLTVDIASGLPDLTAKNFLEKNATLTVWQGNIVQRRLSGIITGVELGENNDWQMNYHLTISPPLWRAGLRQNFRIFQQQDIQAISTTLLDENGITDWTPSFYESHPAREFCVQYGESDLTFLSRLWAEEGIFYFDWSSPTGTEQKLVLCDDVAGVSTLGSLPFNPNTGSEVSTECVSEFRYRAQVRPSSVENQDYTFKTPGWFSRQATHLNGQRTQYEIFDYPGRFKDEQHGQDFARYLADGFRHDAETAVGVSNSAKLYPGKRFTLTGHPSLILNREWQVTGCVLKGEQPQAQHGRQGQGTTLSNNFDVIPADRTWRASPLPKPSVDGPQSAIVTGPAGEEIFCDEHGRVRVRFHWDRYCPGNEDSSCWIRVSQPWAGAGFGHLAIPRVGQEVIVDFLNGDPDQPIIMGRTYHQDNRSPGSLPGTKTQMTIRSKTYKGSGFNELRFEDATGQEQVYIHAQKNMDTEVLNNRTTDVKVDHTETIGNNQSITVGLGQTVTVGKENAGGHDQTILVTHDQSMSIGNDQTLAVTNNRTKTVGNDQDSKVTGNDTETVEKSQMITIGEALSVTVTDSIEFVCGKSTLRMDKDGYITINGHELSMGTTGDQIYKADGDVSMKGKKILEN